MIRSSLLIVTVLIGTVMFALESFAGPMAEWVEQNFLALMLTVVVPLSAQWLK